MLGEVNVNSFDMNGPRDAYGQLINKDPPVLRDRSRPKSRGRSPSGLGVLYTENV